MNSKILPFIFASAFVLLGCNSINQDVDHQNTSLDSAHNWSTSQCFGSHKALISLTPAKEGENVLRIEPKDEQGVRIHDAKVTVSASTLNWQSLELFAREADGIYEIKTDLKKGTWKFDITIQPPGEAKYKLDVNALID